MVSLELYITQTHEIYKSSYARERKTQPIILNDVTHIITDAVNSNTKKS